MKLLFSIFSSIWLFTSYSQEVKEVIKIEIDSECQKCINKRTYVDEIYTKHKTIINGLIIKASVGFSYQDNFRFEQKGKMIYFHFDQDLFKMYETKNIFFVINDYKFKLNNLSDFFKTESINALAEPVKIYSLGYVIEDSLENAILNAEKIELELLNKSNERKSWEIKPEIVKELKQDYNCFKKYYTPIQNKLIEEKNKKEDEYQKNLKEYEFDYRFSKWLDSKENVKKSNTDSLIIEKTDALAYDVKLNNDRYKAFYYFNNNRLYQGVYLFNESYVNENNFYEKYLEVKKILTSKYGEPKNVIKHRSKDFWNKANEIGMAIQTGEYQEYTLWETKTSKIMLIIEGENYDSELSIRYNSKDQLLNNDVKTIQNIKKTEGF